MRIRFAVPFLIAFLSGCAAFQELEPVPPLQPAERGYIELRNDKENFLLKRNKQYFIKFPRPLNVNFYLVLRTNAKRDVHNYFTTTFHDGEPPILPIKDEAADQDTVSVFAVDTSNTFYFWVIDTVYQDISLNVRYRYAPQWRYTVENKYDYYYRVLVDNRYDRHTYEVMGPQFDFAVFDAAAEQQKLQQKNKLLSAMNDELLKLEKVFPANIASSNDTMYTRYVGLRDDTRGELKFQSDYDAILTIFRRESETRGNFAGFMERASEFEKTLEQKERFRAPILEYLKSVYLHRLDEALPAYDAQLQKKDDLSAIELKPPIADVEQLYIACGTQLTNELKDIRDYASQFNKLTQTLQNAKNAYETASSAVEKKTPWPSDTYYPDLISKLDNAKFPNPEGALARFSRYNDLKATRLLSQGSRNVLQQIDQLEPRYLKAADVVRQINALKPQKDYRGIIHILRNNRDLDFVLVQYADLDGLLLKSQADNIRERLNANDWRGAEDGMSSLLNDRDYLNLSQIAAKKLQTVQSFEVELYERVLNLSTERVDAFSKKNEANFDSVPALYADSAFLPVYTLTFSSESPGRVLEKRRKIEAYLNQMKFIRFPENSIRTIYKELTQAPRDHGVEKARAILAHAKFYQGQDKTVRTIVDECDPSIAKTLTKPKDYRRILVLPVNETAAASNEYLFRVNVKIPTDAKFPVFDVNIKVPSDVAEHAGNKQWFTQMTLNKKVVKTEGHMRVTAPSADNNYEAQITPVQMSKDRDNIIEIRFKYPSFQLFEMSVMGQVPLIRKN